MTNKHNGTLRTFRLGQSVTSWALGFVCAFGVATTPAQARELTDIAQSKTIKVGLRVRDLVYNEKKKELHTRLAEKFAEYLGKKLKAKIKAEIVVSPDMPTFWKNEAGEVKQGESYTPAFFKKVDVYTDVLTINDWRQKLALPVAFLPVKESFLCNFKTKKISLDEVKKQGVKIYTVKDSSFHTLLLKQGYSDGELLFSKDTQALPADTEKHGGQACTVLDSDFALFKAKGTKLTFVGPAVETTQKLAWWTAKESAALNKHVQEFWAELLKSPDWAKSFKDAYGIDYAEYVNIVGNL